MRLCQPLLVVGVLGRDLVVVVGLAVELLQMGARGYPLFLHQLYSTAQHHRCYHTHRLKMRGFHQAGRQ